MSKTRLDLRGVCVDARYKNLLQMKLEENKRKQSKIRFDKEIETLKDSICNFDKKYRFANDIEIDEINMFISKLHFSSPAHIEVNTNYPTSHQNMYLCFLCGSEELLKVFIFGSYEDFLLDIDNWTFFSPYLLLIDEDFIRYIYINDYGDIIEAEIK